MLASQYRHHLWQVDLANAHEIVVYLLLFGFELFLILEALPLAATAHAIVAAHRFCTQRRIFMEAHSHSLHIRTFLFLHLKVNHIAWHDIWNKYHLVVNTSQRLAFSRACSYCHVFQHWKLLLLVTSHIVSFSDIYFRNEVQS